jgi:hypothetical protein
MAMKLVLGLALASASLLSLTAHATTPDPTPTLAADAQSGAATLTGVHHWDGAALSLIVTDWWLSGTIINGQAQDVRLIVEVHLPKYPLLDRATDATGRKLDVIILNRGPSARWHKKASERVAIVLPHDYAEHARSIGLDITVSGKDRGFPITVPAAALASFLGSYAQAVSSAGTTPQPAPETTAAPSAAVTTPPEAPAAVAPANPSSLPPLPAASSKEPASPPPTTPSPTPDTPSSPPTAQSFPPPAAPPGTKLRSLPGMEAAPSASDTDAADKETPSAAGSTTRVDSLGLEFAATSSGAMVLTVKPGSKAEKIGLASGDFIEGVDGHSIKALSADQMAAKIGDPAAKILNCIAAGDVKLH